MAYIGNDLQVAFPSYRIIDDISSGFNGSQTTFALTVGGATPVPFPINPQQCLISVNGVIQKPDPTGAAGFNLVGSNIVFASAPTGGWSFFGVILAGADYVNVGANFPSGTAAAPSITFDSDLDTGIYNSGANQVSIATAGVERFRVDSAGQLEAVSLGSAASPAFSFTTDTNTGIYSPGADQLAISTNGAGKLFVDASGNVSVGSSTAAGGGGVGLSLYNSSVPILTFRNSTTGDTGSDGTHFYASGSDFEINNKEAGYLGLRTSNLERLRITSAGLVGIGTSSPSTLLHIQSTDPAFRFKRSDAGTDAYGELTTDTSGLVTMKCDPANAAAGSGFRITVDNSEALRVDSSGRVGIGTTSPATTFDLSGAYSTNIVAVAALDINCSAGTYFTKTINGNSTFTVSNVPASRSYAFTLELTHTSGTITWFSGVEWPGGVAPTLTTGKTHLFMFITDDGGSRWRASSLINYTT